MDNGPWIVALTDKSELENAHSKKPGPKNDLNPKPFLFALLCFLLLGPTLTRRHVDFWGPFFGDEFQLAAWVATLHDVGLGLECTHPAIVSVQLWYSLASWQMRAATK